MTTEEMQAKFKTITQTGVPAQTKYFLREFVGEFSGKFDDVLSLSEEFMVAAGGGARDSVQELDEQQAHIFLEQHDAAMTVKDMRDALKAIDIDMNKKVAFIEYMMFTYKKSLADLFAEKPGNLAHLIQALEEAITMHEEVQAARQAVEDQMKELESVASSGTGVKAMKAKAELEQLRVRSQTGQNMAEARARAKKNRAQKNLDNGDPMAEEMKKVEQQKLEAKQKEERERAESKQKLADRIAKLGVAN